MPCFTRSLLRWGLIGALALGGTSMLVGPNVVAAGFAQVRSKATALANRFVDDPVALRQQLVALGEAYPQRIASVRGELAAVDRQIKQLSQDSEIARRVVANAGGDLSELKELLAEAEGTAAAKGVKVSIRTRGVRLDIDEARVEARRVSDIRLAYQDRVASNEHQLKFLGEQKQRLEEIVGRLDAEYSDFETKLGQIDRQIDAIERNDRLIEMTRQQKAILADYEKFGKVGNLNQLESKLAELQAVQQAQLDALSKAGIDRDYERDARRQLNDENVRNIDPFEGLDVNPHERNHDGPADKATSL
ncbi:MAG: hypothetical protein U0575_14065, partial [Phycisphaerales bacterium]